MPRVVPLAVLLAAAPAAASPLDDPAIERAVFGGVTEPGASALELDPAALALASGVHLHIDGSSTYDRLAIHRRFVDPDSGAFSDGPSATSTALSPGLDAAIYGRLDQVSAGFGCVWPSSDKFADASGVTDYHALGGDHLENRCLVGGAGRWRNLAFGVTIEFVEEKVKLRFARDTALENGRADVATEGLENPDATETYAIDVTDHIWPPSLGKTAATFGMVAQVVDGWWVAASYRVPQGLFSSHEVPGRVAVTRAPRDGGGTMHGDATVRFSLPQKLRLGVHGRIRDGLDLVVEGRWESLSTFTEYDVRMFGLAFEGSDVPEVYPRARGLRDELTLDAGVEQEDEGQRFRFGAKVGVERGAVEPSRLSALQDYPRAATADLGAQVRIAPAWTLQLGYGVEWAPTADTGGGAYRPIDRLDCIASGYDFDSHACQVTDAGYGLPTASGRYGRLSQYARIAIDVTVR